MQHELVMKAVTQGITGSVFLTLLLLLLFALRNDILARKRLSGIVMFTLAVLALWCFLAFAKAYINVREMILSQSMSRHPNTAGPTIQQERYSVPVGAGAIPANR
jgi:hypothetical protein